MNKPEGNSLSGFKNFSESNMFKHLLITSEQGKEEFSHLAHEELRSFSSKQYYFELIKNSHIYVVSKTNQVLYDGKPCILMN